jgi:hypothetical protein
VKDKVQQVLEKVEAQHEAKKLKVNDKTGTSYLLFERENGEKLERIRSDSCTTSRGYLFCHISVHFI